MDEYIKREDALRAYEKEQRRPGTYRFETLIKYAPSADVAPVRHERWLYDSGSGKYLCSACDEYALSFKKDTLYGGDIYEVCLTDYCPNCGAKMDGGDDNA